MGGFESKYVCAGEDGDPYKSVKRSFGTAVKKAGIHKFRFHDLLTYLCKSSCHGWRGLTRVKELLGHKSLAMTTRYAHLSPGHKREAVNTLDNVLNSLQKEALLRSFGSQYGQNRHTMLH